MVTVRPFSENICYISSLFIDFCFVLFWSPLNYRSYPVTWAVWGQRPCNTFPYCYKYFIIPCLYTCIYHATCVRKKMFWIYESVLTFSPIKLIRIDVFSYRIFKYDEDVLKLYVYPPTDIIYQNSNNMRKKYHPLHGGKTILLVYS